VGPISPEEFAAAEQMLMREDHDECRNEDIRNILELFDGLVGPERPNLPQGHPIDAYLRENDRARAILSECDRILTHKYIPNALLEQIEALMGYRLHWARKQNQLYSALEREGFDRPSIHMWTYDDEVRDKVKETLSLLQSNADELQVRNAYRQMANDLRDLMVKEETILFPTALKLLSDEKFEAMKHGDQEIGFFGIEMPKAPAATSAQPNPDGLASELAALLGKYGLTGGSPTGEMHVAEGMLTLEQINLIYKHLPVDLSYVDENELVRFYSDTTHRVFPRSKGVIGREVRNCHPPKSVHIVEEIIQKFRTGEQSRAEFWINKPEVFIYIVYVAVRDENGKFRGVLEMMQDCTHIRSLQGSQTLLTWEQQEKGEGKETAEDEDKREDSETSEDVGNKENAGTLGDEENRESTESLTAGKLTEITEDTLLKDILEADPNVKTLLFRLSDRFKALNTPLARIMMPKATVKMMSERAEVDLNTLLRELRGYFKL